ncbi:MAG: 3D domain-containing protein [Chloroflexota bacterium]|nr:3D domain-containing protein [Chloroflexota bacterium]
MKVLLSQLAWIKALRVVMTALAVGAFVITAAPRGAAALPTGVTFHAGDAVEVRNTNDRGLRVRTGPGFANDRQATMDEGAVIRVVDGPIWSDGYGWYKVTGYDVAGNTGWSAGAYLYRVSRASDRQAAQAAAPARRAQPAAAPAQRAAPVRQAAPAPQPRATGRTLQMLITGYNGAEFGSAGVMANGQRVYWGAVAVDPTIIPLGTRMYIQGFGQKVFVASDTGSAIKGNRLDIWFPSVQQALDFGGQSRSITLIQ